MSQNLNDLFITIKDDCINLINQKNVDLNELAFSLGMSSDYLKKALNNKDNDFLLYIEMYDILVGW